MTNIKNHGFDEDFDYNNVESGTEIDVDGQLDYVKEAMGIDLGNEYNFMSASEMYRVYNIESYENLKRDYVQKKLDEIMELIQDKIKKKGGKELSLEDRKVVVDLGTHNTEWIDYLRGIITKNNYRVNILSSGESSSRVLHIEVSW